MNEIEITQKAKHGNKYTFGLLVRKYKRQAYFSALAIIASYHDALDDLQQTFIRAYRACDRFNVDKRFFTWFSKIVRNLCLNRIRDNAQRAKPFSIFEIEPDPIDTCDDSLVQLEREQVCACVLPQVSLCKVQRKSLSMALRFSWEIKRVTKKFFAKSLGLHRFHSALLSTMQ